MKGFGCQKDKIGLKTSKTFNFGSIIYDRNTVGDRAGDMDPFGSEFIPQIGIAADEECFGVLRQQSGRQDTARSSNSHNCYSGFLHDSIGFLNRMNRLMLFDYHSPQRVQKKKNFGHGFTRIFTDSKAIHNQRSTIKYRLLRAAYLPIFLTSLLYSATGTCGVRSSNLLTI